MSPLIDNAKHWRERAAEARAIADQMDDPVAARMMREIAESYDRLAEHADARSAATGREPSSSS
jgi:hypothetical protein